MTKTQNLSVYHEALQLKKEHSISECRRMVRLYIKDWEKEAAKAEQPQRKQKCAAAIAYWREVYRMLNLVKK